MLTLHYITGSPYARKVRILLAELGLDYNGVEAETYRPEAEMAAVNPTLKVPVLINGDLGLWESDLIAEYLMSRHAPPIVSDLAPPLAPSLLRPERPWEDRRLLVTIGALADALVALAYHEWADLKIADFDHSRRNEARAHACLDWLEETVTDDGFWPGCLSVMDIALLCPLAWTDKRQRFPWREGSRRGRPKIEALFDRHQARPSFLATPVNDWPGGQAEP